MGHFIELPKLVHPDFAVPNRKPVGPVEIDRSNRFGEKAAFITGSQGSLVCAEGSRTNLSWRTKHSTQHVGSKAGDLYLYADNGGSNDDTLITTDSLPSIATSGRYAKQTFYFYYTPEAAGNNNQRLCYYIGNYCLGFYINLNFGGSSYFGYWANSGYKYYYNLPSGVVSYDKPNFIAVSIDGETKLLSICVNGHDSSDATSTTGTQSWLGQGGASDGPMRINWSEFDNYYNVKGRVHSVGLIHDYFDDHALKDLSKNVYQVLNPSNPITYFIPSAGGGAQEAAFLSALSQSAVFAAVSIKGAGITQAVNLNTQFAGDAASNAAVSAGLQAGYSAGSEISVEADLSFALQSAMSITADAAASSAILAAVQSGILFAAIAQTEATITTGSNVDVVMIAQTSAGGVVEAGVGVDVIAGAQLSADAQTNSDLIATNNVSAGMVSQGVIESNVTGGISVDSQVSAEVSQEVSVSFSLQLDATKTAEAIANASITMNTSLATTILAQAAAEAGISVGQIINVVFTATSINGDVITPEGRTYRVSAESRIFVVPFEDRNFTIH